MRHTAAWLLPLGVCLSSQSFVPLQRSTDCKMACLPGTLQKQPTHTKWQSTLLASVHAPANPHVLRLRTLCSATSLQTIHSFN